MRILLVEDDEDKRDELIRFVKSKINCELTEVRSFQSGLKAIKEQYYNLIILDMTMPTFDITPTDNGGRAQPFGGEKLLYELLRRGIDSKVIVVTQFDLFGIGEEAVTFKNLNQRLADKFPTNYIGAVHYSIGYTYWEEILLETILKNKLLKS